MRAIVQEAYGSAEVLQVREIPRPEITDDEVLVQVVAAGVDRGALHLMTGRPYLMRALGFGVRRPKTAVPGTNVAGRVAAVGAKVAGLEVGAEVYGTCRGAFAEFASASQDKLARMPDHLGFPEAAVVPYGWFAARQALTQHGHVTSGQHVLVVGATGAVGSFAVQFAKASGAEVTGVCSSRTAELAAALGVDHVVTYDKEDFTDGGARYDLVVDVFGRTPVSRLRRVLHRGGRLVIVGGEGDRWIGGIQRQLWASLLSPFVPEHLGAFVVKERGGYLDEATSLIDAGKVAPVLGRSYPLVEAAAAVRDLELGRTVGRIALTV